MIYVHVPFCRSFCTYCDFYSEIATERAAGLWADRLITEIEARSGEITADVPTLYIGGGTPSVLPLSVLERIVAALGGGPWEEFTLEANPEDIVEKGPEYLAGLRALGVNRISMGVQSLDDGILRWMNRRHNAERARKAFGMARMAGFGSVSVDLIFGFPLLTEKIWEDTIRETVAMHPEHISCYQLSVESGSALGKMAADGRFTELSPEACRGQYDTLCRALREAGYRHYEISNFAIPGHEAVHNSAYWRRVPYVGFGPGAHSFDGRTRRWNSSSLDWQGFESEALTEEDERVETIMLSLRTDLGINCLYLHEKSDGEAVSRLLERGDLEKTDERYRIPEDRMFVSDAIIRELI